MSILGIDKVVNNEININPLLFLLFVLLRVLLRVPLGVLHRVLLRVSLRVLLRVLHRVLLRVCKPSVVFCPSSHIRKDF